MKNWVAEGIASNVNDFTHHTVSLDTILEKNNNHVGKFKALSPSV